MISVLISKCACFEYSLSSCKEFYELDENRFLSIDINSSVPICIHVNSLVFINGVNVDAAAYDHNGNLFAARKDIIGASFTYNESGNTLILSSANTQHIEIHGYFGLPSLNYGRWFISNLPSFEEKLLKTSVSINSISVQISLLLNTKAVEINFDIGKNNNIYISSTRPMTENMIIYSSQAIQFSDRTENLLLRTERPFGSSISGVSVRSSNNHWATDFQGYWSQKDYFLFGTDNLIYVDDPKPDIGLIVGICALLLVIVSIFVIIFFVFKKRKKVTAISENETDIVANNDTNNVGTLTNLRAIDLQNQNKEGYYQPAYTNIQPEHNPYVDFEI